MLISLLGNNNDDDDDDDDDDYDHSAYLILPMQFETVLPFYKGTRSALTVLKES